MLFTTKRWTLDYLPSPANRGNSRLPLIDTNTIETTLKDNTKTRKV